MVFTQSRGFVVGASFRSLRCRVLVCHAADTASLATRVLFGKLNCVATLVGFGEKQCRKNLPLADTSEPQSPQRSRSCLLPNVLRLADAIRPRNVLLAT